MAEILTQPPLVSPKFKQQSEIKSLQEKAERAINEKRLSKPQQDNALYYIEALLSKAPDNKHAIMLLSTVVKAYSDLVNKKLEQQNIDAAVDYHKLALDIAKKYKLKSQLLTLSGLKSIIEQKQKQITERAQQAALTTEAKTLQRAQAKKQQETKAKDAPQKKKQISSVAPTVSTKPLKGQADEPTMVAIPVQPGHFRIGSPYQEKGRDKNERQTEIPIPSAYALSRYEVTLGAFREFVDATNYSGQREGEDNASWLTPGFEQKDQDPVVNVSWNDAMAYINWLNQRYPTRNYRLPSEAEWEYAARGESGNARFWGDNVSQACAYANVHDLTSQKVNNFSGAIQCNDQHAYTAPVNSKVFQPNGFGLYHMLGNVREWTCSNYGVHYKGQEQQCVELNAEGLRVLRGGSWKDKAKRIRSSDRDVDSPDTRNNMTGFRLARSL